MSQEALKNYTLQTLNFGSEFLTKVSEIKLPEDLSEMQIKLSECFAELNKIWNSVNKLAYKLNGDCGMGDLKSKLKQMEIDQNAFPKRTLSKSKSIGDLVNGEDMDSKMMTSSYTGNIHRERPPSYANWSPMVPPKVIKKKTENSINVECSKDNVKNNKPVVKGENNYTNLSGNRSFQGRTEERTPVKPNTNSLPRFCDSFQRSNTENPTSLPERTEEDYLPLESERQLPDVKKFTLISKAKNVTVNDWQLGERYCGISGDALYIFYSFQDPYAEISMYIPTLFIGKGYEKEKSVLFQSRDLQVKIYLSNDDIQEKLYKATFQAQNKYNLQHSNPPQSSYKTSAPQMPKPYSKKEQGPVYLNTNSWSEKISRSRLGIEENSNKHSNSSDDGEEDYVDMLHASPTIKSLY